MFSSFKLIFIKTY